MNITRNGAIASRPGQASHFTGTVRMDMEFNAEAPGRAGGVTVTFEPGARTAWHTHPLGQTVIVTAGLGWARIEGEAKEEIRPGDIVWFPPGVRHWHGATASTAMAHIAIAESINGSRVRWEEHVPDADYLSA